MKKFEEPKLEVIRLEMAETLTSDIDEALSGILDYGEDVEEW